jgi:hypothetical protein
MKQPNSPKPKEPENFRELLEAMEQATNQINQLASGMDPGSVDQKFGIIMHQINVLGSIQMQTLKLLVKQHGELVIASSIKQVNN